MVMEIIGKTPDAYRLPGLEVRIHNVAIDDPYANSDGNQELVNQLVADRMAEGFRGEPEVDLSRHRGARPKLDNPATRWMYENVPGFDDWHALVPSAAALDPIYTPYITALANDKPFTPEMRMWMLNISDAIGIRSRGTLVEGLIVNEAAENPDEVQRWLSLACGAAQSTFTGMYRVAESGLLVPHATLVDFHQAALSTAAQSARERGLDAHVDTRRMNIVNPRGLAYDREKNSFGRNILAAATKLPARSYDVVDAVGFTEYLGEDNRQFDYGKVIKTKREAAGAVTFLRNAFELVKPGGLLIVGNMRDTTHPQLGFTLNVIQWPHIQPRSIDDMVRIIHQAGLEGELDVYCPQDGVYAIYAIRKPL